MEPTLFTNNVLLTEHISPRLQKIKRGDIIVAKSPTDPRQFVCKRVTGIAGDNVRNGFFNEVVRILFFQLVKVWLLIFNFGYLHSCIIRKILNLAFMYKTPIIVINSLFKTIFINCFILKI